MTDEAWADLHARLRGFVSKRVGDSHAADDIAQDVLLRLHRNLPALRDGGRLDAFAYQIARNAIVDHYRAHARSNEIPSAPEDVAEQVGGPGFDTDADATRAVQDLARCLDPLIERLAAPYREALLLTDLGQVSQTEAARIAGVSVPGMKSRVQRARFQLHDLLTQCCTVELDSRQHITDVERTGPCACAPD